MCGLLLRVLTSYCLYAGRIDTTTRPKTINTTIIQGLKALLKYDSLVAPIFLLIKHLLSTTITANNITTIE
jgi:hypothetical protein